MIPSFRSKLNALKNDLAGGRKRRRAAKRQPAAIVDSPRIVQTEKLEERQLLSSLAGAQENINAPLVPTLANGRGWTYGAVAVGDSDYGNFKKKSNEVYQVATGSVGGFRTSNLRFPGGSLIDVKTREFNSPSGVLSIETGRIASFANLRIKDPYLNRVDNSNFYPKTTRQILKVPKISGAHDYSIAFAPNYATDFGNSRAFIKSSFTAKEIETAFNVDRMSQRFALCGKYHLIAEGTRQFSSICIPA